MKKSLFEAQVISSLYARKISEVDRKNCLKLLRMVREKYGIDAYLYFRNMLAVVVMKEKYDYGGTWIPLWEFNSRNLEEIPLNDSFEDIKNINYAGRGYSNFFGISIKTLKSSFTATLSECTDYWIAHCNNVSVS